MRAANIRKIYYYNILLIFDILIIYTQTYARSTTNLVDLSAITTPNLEENTTEKDIKYDFTFNENTTLQLESQQNEEVTSSEILVTTWRHTTKIPEIISEEDTTKSFKTTTNTTPDEIEENTLSTIVNNLTEETTLRSTNLNNKFDNKLNKNNTKNNQTNVDNFKTNLVEKESINFNKLNNNTLDIDYISNTTIQNEKRGKYLKDYTTMPLPQNSEAWELTKLKSVNNNLSTIKIDSVTTKMLTDWTYVMQNIESTTLKELIPTNSNKIDEKNEIIPNINEKIILNSSNESIFNIDNEKYVTPGENLNNFLSTIHNEEEKDKTLNDIINNTPEMVTFSTLMSTVTTTNENFNINNTETIQMTETMQYDHLDSTLSTILDTDTSTTSTATTTNKFLEQLKTVPTTDEVNITKNLSKQQTTTESQKIITHNSIDIKTDTTSPNVNVIEKTNIKTSTIQDTTTMQIAKTTDNIQLKTQVTTIINKIDNNFDDTTLYTSQIPIQFTNYPSDDDDKIKNKFHNELTTIDSIHFTDNNSINLDETETIDPTTISNETDYNVIIAISVSVVGIIALILLVGFLYVMRKRQKQLTYGQRCRPVSLDAYSLDNISVYNSVRRKGGNRASKRSYGNVAFDDPALKRNNLTINELGKFIERKSNIIEEFKDIPQIIARSDEVPQGCEDKNRYANVIPLPETRVMLTRQNDDEKTEYINANFVRGPKDSPNYYIACQAPLESTVPDFWRMIWEQKSRVIIMATDLFENGIEKCAEYIPASITLENHINYGDYQITLKNREVKEKYAVSTLHVKNITTNSWREIIHFWYQWPEKGVPTDEAAVIAMLLEARSYLKISLPEEENHNEIFNGHINENNGIDKTRSLPKIQGPLTVHCSPGTGRTGTIISCDIALRSLEEPKRSVDIPQIVYYVRRGRASSVQTKDQYEFIYRVANMYANKISGPINDN